MPLLRRPNRHAIGGSQPLGRSSSSEPKVHRDVVVAITRPGRLARDGLAFGIMPPAARDEQAVTWQQDALLVRRCCRCRLDIWQQASVACTTLGSRPAVWLQLFGLRRAEQPQVFLIANLDEKVLRRIPVQRRLRCRWEGSRKLSVCVCVCVCVHVCVGGRDTGTPHRCTPSTDL